MAYIAPRSLEESGHVDEDILGKTGSRKEIGRLKSENKMSLDDVWKWEVTYFHTYWQVMETALFDWPHVTSY